MKIKLDPVDIWAEHETCKEYNTAIDLTTTVKQNEDFYVGNQWEGVYAPDLDHPTFNFIQRVISFFVAMIVSDDVATAFSPFDEDDISTAVCEMLENEVDKIIERNKAKNKGQMIIRNAAVDGDSCFYMWFNADEGENGEIEIEIVDNTKIEFANPYCVDPQKQPYILIIQRLPKETVKDMMRANGRPETDINAIVTEYEGYYGEDNKPNDLVTLITKLYREKGKVYFTKTTSTVVVQKPTDTKIHRYPIAWMSWVPVKNSYHGHAAVSGLIPNQIYVNKLMAMAMEHQKRLAFPKLFYDMTKIKEWSNRVGQAIGVAGDPNVAVASTFRGADMSNQVLEIVDRTISYTRDFMGASDAALGNVRPENTSAIVAVQKAASAPLELQRMSYYQFWEDTVLVLLDMLKAYYGKRDVYIDIGGGVRQLIPFDFGTLDYSTMKVKVDVGAASYWSEIVEAQTADAMFQNGIIQDAATYLEAIPNGYIRNKNKLLKQLRQKQQEAEAMAQQQQAMAQQQQQVPQQGGMPV